MGDTRKYKQTGITHMVKRYTSRRLPIHNEPPAQVVDDNVSSDVAKAEFGRRLQRKMVQHNMTQSDLARSAAQFLKPSRDIRDLISKYIRGLSLPSAVNLSALARALDCEPADLLPTRGVPTAGDHVPELDIRGRGDKAWLRVNQLVDYEVALEVAKLLKRKD